MELKKYWGLFLRWKWLFAALFVIGALGGLGGSILQQQRQAPIYEASTTLLINQGQGDLPDVNAVTSGSRLADTYSELILKRSVLESVIANLNLNTTVDDLTKNISVSTISGTNVLQLSVRAMDPQRAADIANEIARVFIDENTVRLTSRYVESQQSLQNDINAVQQTIGDLTAQIDQLATDITNLQADLKDLKDSIATAQDRQNALPNLIQQAQIQVNTIDRLPSDKVDAGLTIQRQLLAQQILDMQAEQTQLEQKLPQMAAQQADLESQISDTISKQSPLQVQLDQAQSRYQALLKSNEDLRLAEANAQDFMSVVNPAQPGKRINPPQPRLLITLEGAIAGLAVAASLVLLLDYLNDTVRSGEEAERLTGVPTLGVIGRFHGSDDVRQTLITAYKPRAPISEAYRLLRANLEFVMLDQQMQTILVTSTGPVEGKTTTVANLAVTLAQIGRRVILVDLDLRRPTIHKLFQQSNKVGVTTALFSGDAGRYLLDTGIENLRILTSGPLPPNPADLLQSPRMHDLLEEMKRQADLVLIDTPPVLPVADPVLLARQCDATLLVVLAENTRTGLLRKAREQLDQAGAHVLGVVLNRVETSRNGYYYYDRYYYYSSDDSE